MSDETGDKKEAATAPRKTTARRTTKKAGSTAAKKPAAKTAASRKTSTSKTSAAKSTASKTKTSKTAAKTAQKAGTAKPAETKTTANPNQEAEKTVSQQEEPSGASTMNSENTSQSGSHQSSQILEDLKGRDWPKILTRALLMFFFGVLGSAALWVAFFLAAAQVVFTIFAGETNPSLTRIIKQLANFIHDVLDYLSFASDETPFPFERKWPDAS